MQLRHQTTRDPIGDSGANFEVTAMEGSRLSQPPSEKWEKFAEEDHYTYIWTSLKGADRAEFWQSGTRTIEEEFLSLFQLYKVRPILGLELGCGIGRLVLPLARHFQKVVGVDIAQGMVQRAVSFARANRIKNASFLPISGPRDVVEKAGNYIGKCDFIYSLLVFQHIPQFPIIEGYLHAVRVLLHEDGLAYLQFDTRPRDFAYRVKTSLPDFLLPRFWRRGIRRIRRSAEEIKTSIRRSGMEIVGELTPQSAYHRYVLRIAKSSRESK